jgi:hypothetical protein
MDTPKEPDEPIKFAKMPLAADGDCLSFHLSLLEQVCQQLMMPAFVVIYPPRWVPWVSMN